MMQGIAQIGAVFCGAILDQILHRILGLEDTGVVGEKAEQQTHQKDFERVSFIAVTLQSIVQVAHLLHGFDIDRVLLTQLLLAITGNEAKMIAACARLCTKRLGFFGKKPPVSRNILLLMKIKKVLGDPDDPGE